MAPVAIVYIKIKKITKSASLSSDTRNIKVTLVSVIQMSKLISEMENCKYKTSLTAGCRDWPIRIKYFQTCVIYLYYRLLPCSLLIKIISAQNK